MLEYLRKIKNGFSFLITLYHLFFTILIAILLYIAIEESFLKWEIILFILSALLYLSIRFLLNRYTDKSFSSQEEISRTMFKNTRMVINNVSHEIRTPLNAIMGFANNLYEIEKDETKLESLQAIKLNSDRLFALAKKLIDFSSIETGQFQIYRERISNHALLLDLENKYKNQILLKKLKLKINDSIPDRYRIYTDYNVIFEILDMLLENAVKFTDRGEITISSHYEGNKVHFSVKDTGCGVSDDIRDYIFQLYRQGNSDLDREYEGLGLGLTIAEKLTQMLGGTIEIANDSEIGTRFLVQIPAPFIEEKELEPMNTDKIVPHNLSEENLSFIREAAESLSEYVKVFNPDRIRTIAHELNKKDEIFTDLSENLIKFANTFNESEFSLLVGELLKGSKNED